MTSLLKNTKQIANGGYYITVGTGCATKFYANVGTDAAPTFANGPLVSSMSTLGPGISSLVNTAGSAIFRDHGKTLISSGRTFRKVQLLLSTGTNVTEGVTGVADGAAILGGQPSGYLTGYLELPGTGGASSSSGYVGAPVARLG